MKANLFVGTLPPSNREKSRGLLSSTDLSWPGWWPGHTSTEKNRAGAVLSYECGGGFSPEAPGIITLPVLDIAQCTELV